MWTSSVGVEGLKAAARGSTRMIRPPDAWKPVGEFIQAFVITTNTDEAAPEMAIGIEQSQWASGRRLSHPYRYMPRKIASMKTAKPSAEKGSTMMVPLN